MSQQNNISMSEKSETSENAQVYIAKIWVKETGRSVNFLKEIGTTLRIYSAVLVAYLPRKGDSIPRERTERDMTSILSVWEQPLGENHKGLNHSTLKKWRLQQEDFTKVLIYLDMLYDIDLSRCFELQTNPRATNKKWKDERDVTWRLQETEQGQRNEYKYLGSWMSLSGCERIKNEISMMKPWVDLLERGQEWWQEGTYVCSKYDVVRKYGRV